MYETNPQSDVLYYFPKSVTYKHQHNAHADLWMVQQIEVIRTDAMAEDCRYMATFGDDDLDCLNGFGKTVEEAKEDLCMQANVWYEPNEINGYDEVVGDE